MIFPGCRGSSEPNLIRIRRVVQTTKGNKHTDRQHRKYKIFVAPTHGASRSTSPPTWIDVLDDAAFYITFIKTRSSKVVIKSSKSFVITPSGHKGMTAVSENLLTNFTVNISQTELVNLKTGLKMFLANVLVHSNFSCNFYGHQILHIMWLDHLKKSRLAANTFANNLYASPNNFCLLHVSWFSTQGKSQAPEERS